MKNGQKKYQNPLPCGCGIKGTPTMDAFGNSMHYANLFIDFCPMHKATGDLLEASKAWEIYLKECDNKIAPDYGYQRVLRDKAAELTRKAITEAEGR